MLLFGFLLVPMILAAPIELTTNNYILKIDDNILTSIQTTDESSNDLNLSGLGIRGINNKVFENLRHVKSLNLANNSLSTLPELVFSYFENLEYLSLANNAIEHFDASIFSGLNNLKSLNISKNPVKHLYESNFFGLGKLTDVVTIGNSFFHMNTRVFESPNLEDKLFEILEKEEAEKTTENYEETTTPASVDSLFLDKSLKVKLCIRDGIVEKLEAFKNDDDLEPHCKDVKVNHEERMVSLRHLGISKFSTGWYHLQDYPIDTLNLEGNNIVDLSPEILNGLPKGLNYVNLSGNKIERLVKGRIANDNLIVLNLVNNSISDVEDGAFENTKLSSLTMEGNRLRNTSFVATLPPTLKQLLLAENRIDELSDGSFSGLDKLIFLDLTGNNITEIKSESLRGLISLELIVLAQNNLKKIEPGSMRDLKALKILDLHRNNLTSLEKSVFDGLSSIESINLYHNKLTKITSDSLHGLPDTLKELHLAFNQIEMLETGTFVNVPKVSLFLNNNKITKIENGSFNLPTLETLTLQENLLSQPDGESFAGLGRLRYLHLQGNGISKIEKGIAKHLGRLFSLDISYNPIKTLQNGALFGLPKSKGSTVELVGLQIELIQGGVFDDL